MIQGNTDAKTGAVTLNGSLSIVDAKTGRLPLKLTIGKHQLALVSGPYRSNTINFEIIEPIAIPAAVLESKDSQPLPKLFRFKHGLKINIEKFGTNEFLQYVFLDGNPVNYTELKFKLLSDKIEKFDGYSKRKVLRGILWSIV